MNGNCTKHGIPLKPLFTSMFCPKCDAGEDEEKEAHSDEFLIKAIMNAVSPPGYATSIPINFSISTSPVPMPNPKALWLEASISAEISIWKAGGGLIVDTVLGSWGIEVSTQSNMMSGLHPWVLKGYGNKLNVIELYLIGNATYSRISSSLIPDLAFMDANKLSYAEVQSLTDGFDGHPLQAHGSQEYYNVGLNLRKLR